MFKIYFKNIYIKKIFFTKSYKINSLFRAVLPPAPSLSSGIPTATTGFNKRTTRMPQAYNMLQASNQMSYFKTTGSVSNPAQMMTNNTANGRNSFRIACSNYPVDEFFVDQL